MLPSIFTLEGTDPTLPTADLAPLSTIVGNSAVVALGETVHTVGGFYEAKDRVFRYLVEEEGFRAFAFESPWVDADLVAEYVSSGSGDASSAVIDGLFRVWQSEEVLVLVEWMRAWNVDHPDDPVSFFGFDVQQPWYDGPALIAFLGDVLPDEATALVPEIERCNGATDESSAAYYSNPDPGAMTQEDFDACLAALDEVEGLFQSSEAEIVDLSSEDALEFGRIHLVGLRAWQGMTFHFKDDAAVAYEARDEGMADVFLRMKELRNPGGRTALWAHNWHIAARAEDMIDGAYAWAPGARSMGSFLEDELGADYVPIGLLGYQVSMDWPPYNQGEAPLPTDPRDMAVMLHELGHDYLVVDLAFPGATDPFFEPGENYQIYEAQFEPAVLFRGLIFLDGAPAMTPLSW